ncbi:MAG: flagellar hook-length control protein FliK [Phycisphaerae bacterium]|nr:flagellar hook-length control protein FliK [Phycisphaerae bacterium]
MRFIAESAPAQAPARSASLPDQVARGLATLLRHQGGSVTIRLTPESLGQIKINLKIEDAHVWASFQPSSDASRDAIQQSLASLRASLESRGLVVERLEVAPAATFHFDQSLRDSNPRPHTPAFPDSIGPDDPNTAGSQTGTDPDGRGDAHHPTGRHEPGLARADDQGSPSHTELLPDSMGPASVLLLDSPGGPGLARRLRLDAVA